MAILVNQNPYAYQGDPGLTHSHNEAAKLKHSLLGIGSFVLALLSGIGIVLSIVVIGAVVVSDPEIANDESSPAMISLGLVMLGFMLLAVVAFALGFISLFMPNRKKLFGILGMTASFLVGTCFVFLMVLGAMA